MTYLSIFRIIDIFSQFQARYSGISQEQFMHILNIHHPCHPRMHATQTLMCARLARHLSNSFNSLFLQKTVIFEIFRHRQQTFKSLCYMLFKIWYIYMDVIMNITV